MLEASKKIQEKKQESPFTMPIFNEIYSALVEKGVAVNLIADLQKDAVDGLMLFEEYILEDYASLKIYIHDQWGVFCIAFVSQNLANGNLFSTLHEKQENEPTNQEQIVNDLVIFANDYKNFFDDEDLV